MVLELYNIIIARFAYTSNAIVAFSEQCVGKFVHAGGAC